MTNTSALTKKTVSILGCGWYGLELAKALIEQGYQVKGSSTTIEKLEILSNYQIQPFLVNIQKSDEHYNPSFFKSELLFVCIPPKKNAAEQADFFYKIERIVNAAKDNKIKQLIFISSSAVYGDTNSKLTELDTPHPETASGKAMLKVEALLKNQTDFTSTIIRFAGLVGPKRHPGRFFAGKENIPNGRAPVNLIHLDDCIGISLAILKNEAFGFTFNACAPHHPSKQDFYTLATKSAGLSPALFVDELLTWKIVDSINTSRLKYNYLIANWIKWLEKDNSN